MQTQKSRPSPNSISPGTFCCAIAANHSPLTPIRCSKPARKVRQRGVQRVGGAKLPQGTCRQGRPSARDVRGAREIEGRGAPARRVARRIDHLIRSARQHGPILLLPSDAQHHLVLAVLFCRRARRLSLLSAVTILTKKRCMRRGGKSKRDGKSFILQHATQHIRSGARRLDHLDERPDDSSIRPDDLSGRARPLIKITA